ncbi:hypothetical protein POM88_014493 [Heracleum sosnowskyi]|uniref:Pentatricopeptide repeat-containing protein n=1 Tax=Heracleum sosnowskyi TaxID=360622 RepID=A0AAD8J0H3_9APIA|nr:hypothetical protein POM88_014493 [Heracleum sosnowskyi]
MFYKLRDRGDLVGKKRADAMLQNVADKRLRLIKTQEWLDGHVDYSLELKMQHVEAQKFFKEMMLKEIMLKKGLKLNKETCSIVLHGLCQNGYVAEALSFHTVECSGLSPDILMYGILIDGLSKDGQLKKAENLFESLPSKGLKPNVKTYTMMIKTFCQEGLLDEACKLFVEMEACYCLPNNDEMPAHGFSADASSTSLLLDLLESKEHDPTLLAMPKKFLR